MRQPVGGDGQVPVQRPGLYADPPGKPSARLAGVGAPRSGRGHVIGEGLVL